MAPGGLIRQAEVIRVCRLSVDQNAYGVLLWRQRVGANKLGKFRRPRAATQFGGRGGYFGLVFGLVGGAQVAALRVGIEEVEHFAQPPCRPIGQPGVQGGCQRDCDWPGANLLGKVLWTVLGEIESIFPQARGVRGQSIVRVQTLAIFTGQPTPVVDLFQLLQQAAGTGEFFVAVDQGRRFSGVQPMFGLSERSIDLARLGILLAQGGISLVER